MTEWYERALGSAAAEAILAEDNSRVNRLETLFRTIHLPYDRPEHFAAIELTRPTARFQALLEANGALPSAAGC